MTNQQGAPEALRLAAEVLDWMPTSDTQRSLWERHQEALVVVKAAMVEAQQPAAHVQNPAETEHVAGDMSKNGPGSNTAQQPAPSAAAAWKDHQTREVVNQLRDCAVQYHATQQLRDRLLHILGPMIDWIRAAQQAPQPSPTPQADSQPAPVLDDAFDCACVALNNFSDRASIALILETLRNRVDRVVLAAARAPADSVTAPAGVSVNRIPLLDERDQECALVRTTRGWDFRRNGNMIRELNIYERLFVESALAATPTPPAQAADSVLEDAARWQALESCVLEINGGKDWMSIVLKDDAKPETFLKGMLADKLAALAARKQGGAA